MCLTFEVTIAYGFLDIETNVYRNTHRRTDGQTCEHNQYETPTTSFNPETDQTADFRV